MVRTENNSGIKNKEHTLIVIAGPTASGKTELAIQLALKFKTEIISADARQFYRELNIGTAKPTFDQLNKVKHHFINSLSIQDEYSAGKYRGEASVLLNNLFSKHKNVVLVGGSGLFINALLYGFDNIPEVNAEAKEKVKNLFHEKGIIGLQELLMKHDIDYYNQVDLQNPYRLSRALEIYFSTGETFSSFRKAIKTKNNFNVVYYVLNLEKNDLYNRINSRVDNMMKEGLSEEANLLLPFRKLNALNTVGYKELFEYFDGQVSLETAIEKIKQHTRNYAKRQLTWFRKEINAQWMTAEKINAINKI